MEQAITLTKDVPNLKELAMELKKANEDRETKKAFIKKQIENIEKEYEDQWSSTWDKIQDLLKAKGLLPEDYSKSKYVLSFDKSFSVISIGEKSDDPHPLQGLFDALRGKS